MGVKPLGAKEVNPVWTVSHGTSQWPRRAPDPGVTVLPTPLAGRVTAELSSAGVAETPAALLAVPERTSNLCFTAARPWPPVSAEQ